VVGITLDPRHPWKDLLQELLCVALGDTELSDPDGLVESVMEVLEVLLEVLGLVPGVVVGNDKVDLAVTASIHELLEPVDTLAGFVAVGDGWGADAKTFGCERLDVLAVSCYCSIDIDVGTSATGR
jgi:hypothetical protein